MPAGLSTHSRTATPARLAQAVREVVTATDRRRTSPNRRAAPGTTYLRPTTSRAGHPRRSPRAIIATAPVTAAIRGPPSASVTATGTRPNAIATRPPAQPQEDAPSMHARLSPIPAPSRIARRASGLAPMGVLFGDVRDQGDRA